MQLDARTVGWRLGERRNDRSLKVLINQATMLQLVYLLVRHTLHILLIQKILPNSLLHYMHYSVGAFSRPKMQWRP